MVSPEETVADPARTILPSDWIAMLSAVLEPLPKSVVTRPVPSEPNVVLNFALRCKGHHPELSSCPGDSNGSGDNDVIRDLIERNTTH